MRNCFLLFVFCFTAGVIYAQPANLWVSQVHTVGDPLQGWSRGACIYYTDPDAECDSDEYDSERLIFATGLNENWNINKTIATSTVQIFYPRTNVTQVYEFNDTIADGIQAPKSRGFATGWAVKGGFEVFGGSYPQWCQFVTDPSCVVQPGERPTEFFSDLWRFNFTTASWSKRNITGQVPGVFQLGGATVAVGTLGTDSIQVTDDDVYLFGGLTVNPLNGEFLIMNDVYHYKISTSTMTLIEINGAKPRARLYTTMVKSPKGFMITGGELLIQDATDETLWEFNVHSKKWKERDAVQKNPTVQLMMASNWDRDNEKRFYFCGGDTNSTNNPCGFYRPADPSPYCQVYNYNKDKFTAFLPQGDPTFPALKRSCQWTSMNGNLYIQGGWSVNPSNPAGQCQVFNSKMWALKPRD